MLLRPNPLGRCGRGTCTLCFRARTPCSSLTQTQPTSFGSPHEGQPDSPSHPDPRGAPAAHPRGDSSPGPHCYGGSGYLREPAEPGARSLWPFQGSAGGSLPQGRPRRIPPRRGACWALTGSPQAAPYLGPPSAWPKPVQQGGAGGAGRGGEAEPRCPGFPAVPRPDTSAAGHV